MLVSEDKDLIEQARFLSQQARDSAPHYEHSTIGYNYRMSNIVAAVGRGQLKVLDERVELRRRIFAYYKKALGDIPGIEFMPKAPYGKSNRWLTVILITPQDFGVDRETVGQALEAENIEARPIWKPMHLQPVFRVEGHSSPVKYASHFTGQAKLKASPKTLTMRGAVKYASPQLNSFTIKIFRSITQMESNSCKINR